MFDARIDQCAERHVAADAASTVEVGQFGHEKVFVTVYGLQLPERGLVISMSVNIRKLQAVSISSLSLQPTI